MLYFEVIICSLSYKRLRFISEVNALSGRDVILFEDKSLKNVKKIIKKIIWVLRNKGKSIKQMYFH